MPVFPTWNWFRRVKCKVLAKLFQWNDHFNTNSDKIWYYDFLGCKNLGKNKKSSLSILKLLLILRKCQPLRTSEWIFSSSGLPLSLQLLFDSSLFCDNSAVVTLIKQNCWSSVHVYILQWLTITHISGEKLACYHGTDRSFDNEYNTTPQFTMKNITILSANI